MMMRNLMIILREEDEDDDEKLDDGLLECWENSIQQKEMMPENREPRSFKTKDLCQCVFAEKKR